MCVSGKLCARVCLSLHLYLSSVPATLYELSDIKVESLGLFFTPVLEGIMPTWYHNITGD